MQQLARLGFLQVLDLVTTCLRISILSSLWDSLRLFVFCLFAHKKVTEKLAETWWKDCRQNQLFSKVIPMMVKN